MKTLQDCLYNKLLLPSAFKVYAFLCLNAEDNAIEICLDELSHKLRMSHTTVTSGIKDLCEYGFIEAERYRKNKERKALPNRYVLL